MVVPPTRLGVTVHVLPSVVLATLTLTPYEKAKVVFPDLVKVDGVGSEAYYLSFGSQLHVSIGGQELVISGLFPGDDAAVQAEVIAFGKTLVGKL